MKSEAQSPNLQPQNGCVTIFGSSRPASEDAEYQLAHELGALLARSGYTVCNGGYGGIMEGSARGARENGGETIGVVTKMFGTGSNPYISRTIMTNTHSERLLKLVELGDAYIVLKGGTGTLLEFAFVWEYLNKGIIRNKPIIVLGDFWVKVIETLNSELAWEGLQNATKHVSVVQTADECLRHLNSRMR